MTSWKGGKEISDLSSVETAPIATYTNGTGYAMDVPMAKYNG